MANVSKDDLRPEILLKTDQTALAVNVACNGLAVAEGTSPARTVYVTGFSNRDYYVTGFSNRDYHQAAGIRGLTDMRSSGMRLRSALRSGVT
jgi:hypothetical protein